MDKDKVFISCVLLRGAQTRLSSMARWADEAGLENVADVCYGVRFDIGDAIKTITTEVGKAP